MRYLVAVFLAVVLVFMAAQSYSYYGVDVKLRVVSDDGKDFLTIPFKDFRKGGTHVIKEYLEAKKGENYNIFIDNNTSSRVGVVVAVDGRNIIDGKVSHLERGERMYIIDSYGSVKLEGWRTDGDTVHSFYFTDEADSYADRTFGDRSATGVIAAAVFREVHRPEPVYHYEREGIREEAAGKLFAPGADIASEVEESVAAATGFGDERYSPVRRVDFEAEEHPFEKMLVKYEWRETLCSRGLLRCQEDNKRLWDDDCDYAPYPPDYNS
jgi:hypothetical protein